MGCIFLCCLLGLSSSSLSIHSCIQEGLISVPWLFRCRQVPVPAEEPRGNFFNSFHLLTSAQTWEQRKPSLRMAWLASCASGWVDTFMWASFSPRQALVRITFWSSHLVLLHCGPGSCPLMVVKHPHIPSPSPWELLAPYARDSCSHFTEEGQKAGSSLFLLSVTSVVYNPFTVGRLFPMCQALCPFLAVLSCRTLAGLLIGTNSCVMGKLTLYLVGSRKMEEVNCRTSSLLSSTNAGACNSLSQFWPVSVLFWLWILFLRYS